MLLAWGGVVGAVTVLWGVGGAPSGRDLVWGIGVLLFVLLFLLSIAALVVGTARRRHRLERLGHVVAGEVLTTTWVGDGEGLPELLVRYACVVPPDLEPEVAELRLGVETLAAQGGTPASGDTVFVLYDPARPARRAVWGFARRPAD